MERKGSPEVFVVVGMHKSGTTLVADILHNSGVEMVERYDSTGDYDIGRKVERQKTKRINESILGEGHSLDGMDGRFPLVLEPTQLQAMKAAIGECEERGTDWGFKDPRTCLTYALWEPLLPDHKLVIVYRNPREVIAHYAARQDSGRHPLRTARSRLAARRAWNLYNARLLEIARFSQHPMIVLDYGRLMTSRREFDRFSSFVGRDLVDVRRLDQYRNQRKRTVRRSVLAAVVPGYRCTRRLLARLEELRS